MCGLFSPIFHFLELFEAKVGGGGANHLVPAAPELDSQASRHLQLLLIKNLTSA